MVFASPVKFYIILVEIVVQNVRREGLVLWSHVEGGCGGSKQKFNLKRDLCKDLTDAVSNPRLEPRLHHQLRPIDARALPTLPTLAFVLCTVPACSRPDRS